MRVEVQIPEYLTLEHYMGFQLVDDVVNDRDLIIQTISIMTGHSVDEIRDWNIEGLIQVYNALTKVTSDTKPIFYPIVDVEGTLYGYQPASKMTVGEYIDLENLSKDTNKNLPEIIALLYRPITSHKLNTMEWKVKNTWKYVYSKQPENLFKYYDIQKYDNKQRVIDAEKMKDFPAVLSLGAISFFLLSGMQLLRSSQISSLLNSKIDKTTRMKNLENRLVNIMDGFSPSTNYQIVPSYKSQEISQYLI